MTSNDTYMLPQDIDVVAKECGEPNAYWSPAEYKIIMCYELVNGALDLHDKFAEQHDPVLDDFVGDVVVGIFNHEMGHALVTVYNLPVTGLEEDAVDQFAALNAVSFVDEYDDPREGQEMLRSFARYWEYIDMDAGEDGRTNYSGVHALSIQRYYNMACLLYGADPEYNQDLVAFGDLPQDRADWCESEYRKISGSWSRLIEPYAEPAWADLP